MFRVYLVPLSLGWDDAAAAVSLLYECLGATCYDFKPGHGWLCRVPRPLTEAEQRTLGVTVWNEVVPLEEPDEEIWEIWVVNNRCICDAWPSEAVELQHRYEDAVHSTPRGTPLSALEYLHYRRLVYRLWDVVDPWYAEELPRMDSAELRGSMSHITPYCFVRFALDVRRHGA